MAFCAPIQRCKVLNDINNIEWNDLWTRNTGWYMPPGPFTFVCYLLYARSDHTMHKFGVAVHFRVARRVQFRHKIGASKMIRLLFALTVVVLMAAHGEYCTTLEFEM